MTLMSNEVRINDIPVKMCLKRSARMEMKTYRFEIVVTRKNISIEFKNFPRCGSTSGRLARGVSSVEIQPVNS
jgi:hypothetical protein